MMHVRYKFFFFLLIYSILLYGIVCAKNVRLVKYWFVKKAEKVLSYK